MNTSAKKLYPQNNTFVNNLKTEVMKHRLLPAILLIAIFLPSGVFAQRLISDSLLAHFTKNQTDSIFSSNGIPITSGSGISCYRLVYSTLNAKQDDSTIASGLVIVPDASTCPMPIAMYDHGTVLQRYDVPSWLNYESLISMLLAGQGYYSIAPDYLGMGVSPGFHPYIHARSEAQAGIDLIFASKAFAAANNISLSQQLFLTGYSQGGHACMATHRAIQQNYSSQLHVTASAPGSGPYNISGIQAAGLANDSFYADPSYIPYLVFSYQSVYGNLYTNVNQFLQHPWDSILPPLYSEQFSTDTIDGLMPHHIDSFVVASQLTQYTNDSANDPLRIDLRDNDVYAWVPTSPVKMTYCTADEQVIYQSTLFALNYFQTHGDSTATAVDGGNYDHLGCVTPAITNMLGFFGGLVVSENNLNLAFTVDSATPNANNASIKVSVTGGTGYTIHWSNGSSDSLITGLSSGTYTVTVTDASGCTKVRSVNTQSITTGIGAIAASVSSFEIFPNPASSQLFIKASNFIPTIVNIYDVNGRLVSEKTYSNQLDISNLASGVYMLEAKNQTATMRSRFIKM